MPVNNINGPVGPERPSQSSRETIPVKTGSSDKTAGSEGASAVSSTQNAPAADQTPRDTVQILRHDRRVEELAAKVENIDNSPREEAVSRATERVRSGYYSTPDFMEKLAVKLINTEPAGS